MSLWTQTGWGWWGGTYDPNTVKPMWSQFSQAQRVVCDLPTPRTIDSGTPPCSDVARLFAAARALVPVRAPGACMWAQALQM
jgi:hypothetical protein